MVTNKFFKYFEIPIGFLIFFTFSRSIEYEILVNKNADNKNFVIWSHFKQYTNLYEVV